MDTAMDDDWGPWCCPALLERKKPGALLEHQSSLELMPVGHMMHKCA